MNRVHQAASMAIIAFSIWVGYEAVQLTYMSRLGPGPGFFPFWLALIMGALSVAWFVQLCRHPLDGKAIDFVPSRGGCIRIAAIIFAVAVFGLFMEKVGFSLMMFAVLLFLLVTLGRRSITTTLTVSILGSFGIYYVFRHYLNVHLPESSIELLRSLGF